MRARLLEVPLVLDRATALEEARHTSLVATVFHREVTPRNIGLFASRAEDRLPHARGRRWQIDFERRGHGATGCGRICRRRLPRRYLLDEYQNRRGVAILVLQRARAYG